MVKTATSQNGDTETATEMAMVKTATNPNNTYSSSDANIIDRRLYTYTVCGMQLLSCMKKSTIFHRVQCLTLARDRFEPVIFY